MKLSEFKKELSAQSEIAFILPSGKLVPSHFHVTEVGEIDKKFIDCGGKIRSEKVVNFQLWEANDYNHRLHPEKLVKIIELSQNALNIEDNEIEVEYQGETIGKYGISFENGKFLLTPKQTDCLAKDNCGIPKEKLSLNQLSKESENTCVPGGGCC